VDVLGVTDRRDAEQAREPGDLLLVPVALLEELLVGLLELLAVLVLEHLAAREHLEIVVGEAGLGRLGRIDAALGERLLVRLMVVELPAPVGLRAAMPLS
jgi:hypothetical protein